MAAVDYFLKIDGIDGESTDAKHKGEIDVESWSWGETHVASPAMGGGGGAGKVVRQDFHFVVHTGKQSPKLLLACATGQHLKSGVLTCRKAGEVPLEFLKIQLTDVLVSSYNVGGTQIGGDPAPRDSFSLNFVRIEMTETSQSPTGAPGAVAFGGFDFQTNQSVPPTTT